jgi:enoyl-CoA hydratase/carnithine racemase
VSELADAIDYRVSDGIAVITLNRPERLNALLPGMGDLYAELLRRADEDPEVRAIVVTGSGRGFCSGADLSVLAQGAEALIGYSDHQSIDTLPTAALRIGTPVVTAINGPCAGIGVILALCADRRVASPTATLSTVFSRLGLIAEYGSAWLLSRLAGLATAQDLLITGRTVDAHEAYRLGLVNEVADDARAAALAWARDVADNCSPTSIAVIKGQIAAAQYQDLDAAVTSSLELMRESFTRPDFGLAVAAKLEGRPPDFPAR